MTAACIGPPPSRPPSRPPASAWSRPAPPSPRPPCRRPVPRSGPGPPGARRPRSTSRARRRATARAPVPRGSGSGGCRCRCPPLQKGSVSRGFVAPPCPAPPSAPGGNTNHEALVRLLVDLRGPAWAVTLEPSGSTTAAPAATRCSSSPDIMMRASSSLALGSAGAPDARGGVDDGDAGDEMVPLRPRRDAIERRFGPAAGGGAAGPCAASSCANTYVQIRYTASSLSSPIGEGEGGE